MRKHLGYFAYYDNTGKVIGLGEEIKITEPKSDGVIQEQLIRYGVGGLSDNKLEIGEDLHSDINNPGKALGLKDLTIKGGRLEIKGK